MRKLFVKQQLFLKPPTKKLFVVPLRSIYRWGFLKNEPWFGKYNSLSLVKLNCWCQALNAIPVHSSCDWGFIALLPVAVSTDSLKIGFDYHRVSETSRVQINSICPHRCLGNPYRLYHNYFRISQSA